MGRLQRKKSSGGKKKNKNVGSKSLVQQQNGAESKKTVPVSAPAANKKQGLVRKKPTAAVRTSGGTQKKNIWAKIIQFLREVKVELKKVAWPSKKQTMGSTLVVLILVIIISFFLGIVDFALSSFIRIIL